MALAPPGKMEKRAARAIIGRNDGADLITDGRGAVAIRWKEGSAAERESGNY